MTSPKMPLVMYVYIIVSVMYLPIDTSSALNITHYCISSG